MLHRIGKFYVFLREIRAELFDDAFQAELAAVTQGKKARYKGARKNTLDVRRCATVINLQCLARLKQAA
jgi:hypothetical protein